MGKVLVVDDSRTVRKTARSALLESKAEVIEAVDGVEGLALAFEHRPDLILVDAMMPRLDGYSLCRLLRACPELSGAEVWMLTGKEGVLDSARARISGAVGVIAKPFDKKALSSLCSKALRQSRAAEAVREG